MNLNIVRVPVKSGAWSFPLYLINMRNIEYTSGGWVCLISYILESNPHPFYSFRGLIRIVCDLWS